MVKDLHDIAASAATANIEAKAYAKNPMVQSVVKDQAVDRQVTIDQSIQYWVNVLREEMTKPADKQFQVLIDAAKNQIDVWNKINAM